MKHCVPTGTSLPCCGRQTGFTYLSNLIGDESFINAISLLIVDLAYCGCEIILSTDISVCCPSLVVDVMCSPTLESKVYD